MLLRNLFFVLWPFVHCPSPLLPNCNVSLNCFKLYPLLLILPSHQFCWITKKISHCSHKQSIFCRFHCFENRHIYGFSLTSTIQQSWHYCHSPNFDGSNDILTSCWCLTIESIMHHSFHWSWGNNGLSVIQIPLLCSKTVSYNFQTKCIQYEPGTPMCNLINGATTASTSTAILSVLPAAIVAAMTPLYSRMYLC